jgi:hypothetical protein
LDHVEGAPDVDFTSGSFFSPLFAKVAVFRFPAAYNQRKDKTVTASEIIFSVQESPEGGYQARALGFSIFTEADSLDELKTMIRDAVSCHFDPAEKPRIIRLHMVKDEVIPA